MSRSTLPPRPTTIPPPANGPPRTTHQKRLLEEIETAGAICKVKDACPIALYSVRHVDELRKQVRRLEKRLTILEEHLTRR